ncbi:MAG: agmatine deiminase family protein [Candidatus Nanopelagicales bacterium]|nr:agmatine deiminase family protein [Candidatus Nanopelagicales bacterium]
MKSKQAWFAKFLAVVLPITALVAACTTSGSGEPKSSSSTPAGAAEPMLLVLAAPSVDDEYYRPAFREIVDFQIRYAQAVEGRDRAVVLVDKPTRRHYEGRLPENALLDAKIADLWLRDFTTVGPFDPVEFVYTDASTETRRESVAIQRSFDVFAGEHGITRERTKLVLDGGNIVDNYAGRVVTTTRFMEDNRLNKAEAKKALSGVLKAREVAIIPPDEDILAHSDGMVMWIDPDTLLVNDYSAVDPELRTRVLDELRQSFPGVKIIEVPVEFDESTPTRWKGFSSACGVNLNAVLTNNYIYVPTFGKDNDDRVLDVIRSNTDRVVVPVDAREVCAMGGSVRCLTWQVTGANMQRILVAAATGADE